MKQVVVLVPGIMGSRLERDGRSVWPGGVLDLLRHFSEDEFQALLAPDLVATDVIRRYFISTQYQSLIDDLARFGFREDDDPPGFYAAPYDWRLPIEHAAEALSKRLDQVASQHGDDVEISCIGHSMGGLVARCLLESGSFDGRPGRERVRLLVCIGTPHRGAPKALPIVLGHEHRLWLHRDQVARLARDPRYPSAYQLLPHRSEPFVWSEDPDSRIACLDAYSDELAPQVGFDAGGLAAAQRFHTLLRGPAPGVRYFCFSGTRQDTASLVALRRVGPAELRPRVVEPEDSGDGTVPDWSSRMSGVQGLAVGGEHATLYRNGEVRRALGALLGATQMLAPGSFSAVEVALRDHFCEPAASVRGLLSFPPSSFLRGELRLERARDPEGSSFETLGKPHSLQYRGLHAESLGVIFDAPRRPGAYRVGFYAAGSSEPSGSDELFVLEA